MTQSFSHQHLILVKVNQILLFSCFKTKIQELLNPCLIYVTHGPKEIFMYYVSGYIVAYECIFT